ncbi:MAG: hypothetical protein KC535_02850 [Nanoarchaeota archaeon]|nr:hypothetical protein [Nanoarchaeota archaeon]
MVDEIFSQKRSIEPLSVVAYCPLDKVDTFLEQVSSQFASQKTISPLDASEQTKFKNVTLHVPFATVNDQRYNLRLHIFSDDQLLFESTRTKKADYFLGDPNSLIMDLIKDEELPDYYFGLHMINTNFDQLIISSPKEFVNSKEPLMDALMNRPLYKKTRFETTYGQIGDN